MEWLRDLSEDLRARHEQQLDEMLKRIDEAYQHDFEQWQNDRPQREEWLRTLSEGKPGEIEETWANMTW